MNNVTNFNKSALFMVAEKLVKMATQLCTLILLAKALGPEDLGNLMYCFAIASMFLFLNKLGLDNVIVRFFVERAEEKYQFLRNAFVIRLVSAAFCVLFINILGLWLVDNTSQNLLLIISFYHIFLPANVLDWYFQSQGRGDLSALGLISGHVVGFIFRILCIYIATDLLFFGVAYVIESIVVAISYFFIARKSKVEIVGVLSINQIKLLLKESTPLILSGAIVLLYMKVDQIMLGKMIDDAEVGIYIAATRLSEAWYFVGLTIISAYFPKFITIRKNETDEDYYFSIIKLGRLLIWGALLLAISTMFVSPWLISVLYGADYKRSADVLMVTIWAVPFVYLGAISTKMYVVLSKNNNILWRSLSGFLINIILNYYLIPIYGANGAAISTLISQIVASYLWNCFYPELRVFSLQNNIINPFGNKFK